MHKIAIALVIVLLAGFTGQAHACQLRAAPGNAEAAAPQNVYAKRMELMKERDSLLLETVQLLKEVAKDKATKDKAEALEKRVQANIEEHNKMHAMMMDGAGGMAGMHPGGQMMPKKDGCCGGKDKPCPMKGTPSDKKDN